MRGVREDGQVQTGNGNVQVVEQEADKKKGRPKASFKIGNEVIKPYTGKENLPKEKLDSKGNVISPGEPRHFVVRADHNTWKLIRVYRAKGVKRSLVRTLKPKRRKKTQKSTQDAFILQKLKEMQIPGAY